MKLKALIVLIPLLAVAVAPAAELVEADVQWGKAVEKMFAEGKTSISTPSEQRARLARQIAEKLGHQCAVERSGSGFRVSLIGAPLIRN
jgi:archaeosine-15-forming tRNA-guanine transglycosylase